MRAHDFVEVAATKRQFDRRSVDVVRVEMILVDNLRAIELSAETPLGKFIIELNHQQAHELIQTMRRILNKEDSLIKSRRR